MSPPSETGTQFCAECGRPSAPDELARFGDLLICPLCKETYAQKLREGVAPAATSQFAGFWIRFVAWLIDAIILFMITSAVQFALLGSMAVMPRITPGSDPTAALAGIMGRIGLATLVSMVIHGIYETLFIASNLAATPGKLALGLKVLRAGGFGVGLGRAAGRYFAKTLSGLILGIGYLLIVFDPEKRALHDMICDTRVVKTRA
jgi:uncharacterized RDD family membrane protein YckC